MFWGIFLLLVVIQDLSFSLYCYKQKRKGTEQNNLTNETVVQKKSLVRAKISCLIQGLLRVKLDFISKIPSHFIRKLFLRYIFHMTIGKRTVIYGKFEIRAPWNIYIGNGVIIGDESKLDGRNKIYIGDNVNLSTGVWLWTEQHDLNDPFFNCNNKGGSIIIGNRVWISNRVILLPNIKIEEGAVIAAGAVVTKNCDSYSVYGGIPAKKINERNRELQYSFNGDHYWFL